MYKPMHMVQCNEYNVRHLNQGSYTTTILYHMKCCCDVLHDEQLLRNCTTMLEQEEGIHFKQIKGAILGQ